MKTSKKIASVLFVGIALQQLALCQTDTNASGAGNPPAMSVDTNQPAPVSAGMETNVMDVKTNMMETATNIASSAVSMSATNEPVVTNETAIAEAASTNVPVAALPPIVFQDVPLTTAIETLARLGGINYLIDPKIGYGQPDKNGQVKPEPNLSIRWENVTYQQALLALLDTYGLQMVENPKTKIAKITEKDPGAPPPLITRVIQLKYASTETMTAAVSSGLTDKRSHVLPDTRTSQLVVVATENEQANVDTLVAQLDKPTRQVLIETKIIELSSNPTTQKGIDWAGTLAAQNVSIGNDALPGLAPQPAIPASAGPPPTLAVPANPGTIGGILSGPQLLGSLNKGAFLSPSTMFLNADGVKAVLSFLNSSSDAQVVSTPRVVTLDNEKATIEVTRAFPIFNTTAGTQGSPGGSQLTYSNLGTTLEVTPRISANDYIWLKVTPSVSSFFGTVSRTVSGFTSQADEFDTRTIDTQVLIPNSHTLVMGGLVKDNPNSQYTKVPFLGDIPVLGLAFRHENKSLEKDNLLIFITPTIVKDTDFKATTTEFLDSQQRTMSAPMNPKTMYDGAQPRGNWSDPFQPTVK